MFVKCKKQRIKVIYPILIAVTAKTSSIVFTLFQVDKLMAQCIRD